MTADELRAALEADMAWRQEDLAFFKNQLNNISEDDKDRYRKSLVLILYSHMEGFVKTSLQTYIQYINSLHLSRKDVTTGLMVAGMQKEFSSYENLDRKCEVFRRELPEDTQLHRFFRRVDFLDSIDSLKNEKLSIDDQIIDTESNLRYLVLKKNLYKIGLPIDLFSDSQGDIDSLVNRRNSIAHGNFRSGISETEYSSWESKALSVMSNVMRLIYDYANNKMYLVS